MQVYNEKEQVGEKEIQNVQLQKKGSTRKYNGAKSSAQGDKRFKEKPDAKWNKGSDNFRARLHPDKPLTSEKEF